MWFGTDRRGITRWAEDSVRSDSTDDGLPGIATQSISTSADGTIWAGFRVRGRREPDGLSRFEGVRSPLLEPEPGGLSRFDGRAWSTVESPVDTLNVCGLALANDGSVWISSWGQGVLRYLDVT